MQVMAHAMSHILADNGKTVLLHQCLNRCADIADPMAGLRRLNTQIQAFLRYVQKLLGLFADLPHRKGKRIVSVESADTGAHINADDVPFLNDSVGRNAVDDLVVDRDAARGRKTAIVQKGGLCSLGKDELMKHFVHIRRGHARFNQLSCKPQRLGADFAGELHIG